MFALIYSFFNFSVVQNPPERPLAVAVAIPAAIPSGNLEEIHEEFQEVTNQVPLSIKYESFEEEDEAAKIRAMKGTP